MTKYVDPFADPAAQEDSYKDPFAAKVTEQHSSGLGLADTEKTPQSPSDKFAAEIQARETKKEPKPDEETGFFEDMGRLFMSGAVSGLEGDVKIADYAVGGSEATKAAGDKLSQINEDLFSGMSPEMREAMSQKFVVDGEDGYEAGDAATNWRSYLGTVASGTGSLATMVLTGGPLKWLVKKGLNKSIKKQLEKAAAKKMSAKKAQEQVAKRIDDISGVAGYGLAEGAMVSGSVGKDIEQSIMELPQEVLDSSAIYAETFNQMYDALPDMPRSHIQGLARKQVAIQMGIEGAKDIALPSVLLGSIAGRYVDKALKGKLASTRMAGAGKAAIVEAPTEAAQGASEQYVQNLKVGEIDPSVDPMADVANSAVAEGIGGMGAGAMLGLASTPEGKAAMGEAQPPQPETIDDSEVTPVQEAPETVAAQMAAVQDGRKPSMLITPGEAFPEDLPEDLATFDLGQKVGFLVYPRSNPEILEQARAEVAETGMVSGHTLGYGTEGKAADSDTVITARDEDGTVIQDVVDDGSQEALDAAEQVAGENGTVETRSAEEAMDEREEALPLTVDEQKEELRQKYRNKEITHKEFADGIAALLEDPRKPVEETPAEETPDTIQEESNQTVDLSEDDEYSINERADGFFDFDEEGYLTGVKKGMDQRGAEEMENVIRQNFGYKGAAIFRARYDELMSESVAIHANKQQEAESEPTAEDTNEAPDGAQSAPELGDRWREEPENDDGEPFAFLDGGDAVMATGSLTRESNGSYTGWVEDGTKHIGSYPTKQEAAQAVEDYLGGSEPQDRRTIDKTMFGQEEHRTGSDRREDSDYRKKVSEMSEDELRQALLTDDLIVDMGNKRAYEESDKKNFQVFIDADSLKYVNDNMGHSSGDLLLQEIGYALSEAFGNDVFHISGDEFVVQGAMRPQLINKLESVLEQLSDVEITVELPDGSRTTLKGLGFSYGIDTDLGAAERLMAEHKIERTEQGLRSDRGEQPPNIVRETAGGQQDSGSEESTQETEAGGVSDDDFEAMLDEEMEAAGIDEEKPDNAQEKSDAESGKIEEADQPLTNEGIDDAAHEAATSPNNDLKEPTEAQKEAENYKLGDVINLHGIQVRVENPKTSYRFKVDQDAIRKIVEGRKSTPNTPDYALANKIYDLLETVLEKLQHNSTVPEAFEALEEAHRESRNISAINDLMDDFMLPDEAGDPKPYWYNEMQHHYGKILGTTGADGDHVDIFLGPDAANPDKTVFIIDQVDPSTGEFDEHKVMVGFDGRVAAAKGYRDNYDKNWQGLHDSHKMTMEEFVAWTKGDTTKPLSDDLEARSEPQQDPSSNPFKNRDRPGYIFNDLEGDQVFTPEAIADVALQTFNGDIEKAKDVVLSSMVEGDERDAVIKIIEDSDTTDTDTSETTQDSDTATDEEKPDGKLQGKKIGKNRYGFDLYQNEYARWYFDSNNEEHRKLLTDLDGNKVKMTGEFATFKGKKTDILPDPNAENNVQPWEPNDPVQPQLHQMWKELYEALPQGFKDEYEHLFNIATNDGRKIHDEASKLDFVKGLTDRINGEENEFNVMSVRGAAYEVANSYYKRNPEQENNEDQDDNIEEVTEQSIYTEIKLLGRTRGGRLKKLTQAYGKYMVDTLRFMAGIVGVETKKNGKNLDKKDLANALLDWFEAKPAADEKAAEFEKAVERSFRASYAALNTEIDTSDELKDLVRESKDADNIKVELLEFVAGWVERTGTEAESTDDKVMLAVIDKMIGDGPAGLNAEQFGDDFVQAKFDALTKINKSDDKRRNKRTPLAEAGEAELEHRLAQLNKKEDSELNGFQYADGWRHAIAGGTMSNLENRGDQSVRIGYQDAAQWMKDTKRTVKGKKQGSTGTALRRAMDGVKTLNGGSNEELEQIYKLTTRGEVMNRDELVDPEATPGVKRYFDEVRNAVLPFKEWLGTKLGGGLGRWELSFDDAVSDRYGLEPDYVVDAANEYLAALEEINSIFEGSKNVEQASRKYDALFFELEEGEKASWSSHASEAAKERLNKFMRKADSWSSDARFTYSYSSERIKTENEPYNPAGNRKKPLKRPRLDFIRREGVKDVRKNKNITPKKLKETFGFTDITIGEHVTSQQEQDHLNYAYDALMTLAETLKLDPKHLSLGGWLHFSVGALGHGKFAAHFQRAHPLDLQDPSKGTTPVINLTNTNGDGAVAHEWMHALDERLAQNSGTGEGGTSSIINYIVENLSYRPPTWEEATEDIKRFWKGSYYPNVNAAAGRGRTAPPIKHALFHLEGHVRNRIYEQKKTGFHIDATEMDKGKKEGYWARRKELFARAGEAYIYDNIKGIDDYLVSSWVEEHNVEKPAYRGRPYPADDERRAFNELFDELFKSLEWTDKGPVIKEGWQPSAGYDKEAFRQKLIDWAKEYDEERKAAKEQKAIDFKIGWNGGTDLARQLFIALGNDNAPKDNRELSKFVEEFDGKKPDATRLKEAQEDLEVALVQRAERLIDLSRSSVREMNVDPNSTAFNRMTDDFAMNALVGLYFKQPLLNIQTTTSAKNQAYSTPAPLAYVAGRLAGLSYSTDSMFNVYEPAAGNGMLMITAGKHSRNVVNEVDPRRFEALEAMSKGKHFRVKNSDATTNEVDERGFDIILTNPPFGKMEHVANFEGYKFTKIDQLIAARALKGMNDDGRATLIIGANKAAGEISTSDRVFLNWLYKNYNVTEHFEVSGDMYTRQGASWPVRVIVIEGRQKSDKVAPKSGSIERIENYAELYNHYQQIQYGDVVPGVIESSGEAAGTGDTATGGSTENELSGQTGGSSTDADRSDTGRAGTGSDRGSAAGGQSGNAADNEGQLGRGDSDTARGDDANQGSDGGRESSQESGANDTGAGAGDNVGLTDDDFEAMIDEEIAAAESESAEEKTQKDDRRAELVPGYGWMVPMRNASEQDVAELVDGYGWMVPVSALESSKPDNDRKTPDGRIKAPKAKKRNKSNNEKTASDHLKDAASSAGAAASDAWSGLNELFGGKGRVGSGLNFDEETYAKAKPLFKKAMQEAIDSGKSLKEALRAVIQQALKAYGAVVKPYLMQFNKDVNREIEEGKIDNNGRPVKNNSLSELQVDYIPASNSGGIQTLTPTNQAAAVRAALKKLEADHGNIDDFLVEELQYGSREALYDALMSHQVDGVALAIYQLKKGKALIIGDQTGVGKGRQAASIIRWAKLNGHLPVFVTAKHGLYTDMYEDLQGIGSGDLVPLITNQDEAVIISDGNGEKTRLFANNKAQLSKDIDHMVLTGTLPEGKDMLFTTYDQLQPAGKNRINKRQEIIRSLSQNGAVFILDESHKAAGKSGTGELMREVLENSGKATYLSATYAKRPDSMPVYFLTDLSLAADSMDDLIFAIDKGGVPLMEIVSAQLTESGQFIRRELSWEGIEIPTWIDPDAEQRARDEAVSDEVTERLRAIVSADRMFHTVGVPYIQENLEDIGGSLLDNVSNFAEASVNHSNFTSVVHNAIAQMTLAIKADRTADMAIEALKRGEKPVIALDSTMGSFLDDYTEMHKIKKGDKLDGFDYRVVLGRLLRRTRRITVVDEFGNKNPVEIPLEMMPPEVQIKYERAADLIEDMSADLAASPIDRIRHRIEEAGYSIKEVTGRNDRVDYSTTPPTYASMDTQEKNDRVTTVAEFNNGQLDVIVMNVAGATGISMHAAEKFNDTKPRHMILAQAALDINVFMQMLGRINRNGQIELPLYTLFSTSLPAEKRPMAVTSSKMKKLNANTSSNETSATSVDAVDMMNKYGDEVIARFLHENPEFREFIHVDYNISSDPIQVAGVAKKATGQLALLSVEMQRDFYERVEADYIAYINYLNETGRNELVAKDVDFKARLVSERILYEGDNNNNPFTADSILGLYSVKKQGFPPKPDDARKAINNALGTDFDMASVRGDEVREAIDKYMDDMLAKPLKHFYDTMIPRLNEKVKKAFDAMSDEEKKQAASPDLVDGSPAGRIIASSQSKKADAYNHAFEMRQRQLDRVNETKTMLKSKFRLGNAALSVKTGEGIGVDGMIVDISHSWDAKSQGNPFAPSRFTVKIMLNSALHQITLPMSAMDRLFEASSRNQSPDQVFRSNGMSEEMSRESRYIVTGNLMRAYSELERHGDIIRFTKMDGSVSEGILLPADFNPQEDIKLDEKLVSAEKALEFLRTNSYDHEVSTYGIAARDGSIRVKPSRSLGGLIIEVAGSAKKGGKWWQSEALVSLIGRDFAGNRTIKSVEVTPEKATKVMEFIFKDSPLYALPSMAHLTEGYTTRNGGTQNPSAFFSRARSRNQQLDNGEKAPVTVQRTKSGLKKEQISEAIKKIIANWKDAPEVVVVQSIEDLPQNIQDDIAEANEGLENPEAIEGIFDSKGTKVFLVADEITSPDVAQRVLIHESVGHYGVRRVFGNDLKSVLRQVYLSQKPAIDEIAERYGLDLSIDENRLIAAEEVLAHMAEKGEKHTLLSKAIAAIREWLRRMGFSLKLSDSDILRIIAQAKNAVVSGKKAKVGGTTAMSRRHDQDDNLDPHVKSLMGKMGHGDKASLADRFKHSIRPGLKERLKILMDKMIQASFDQFHGLKKAEELAGGAEYDRSAYVAARMSTSIDSQLMVAMSKGPLRWLGNRATYARNQKGLLEILQPVEDNIELWEAYMVAKRAQRLQAEGKENLITPEEIEAGLALLDQHPEFEKVAQEWAKFNKTMLDFAQDAGLINPDSRAIWEHDDYIPFYRILDEEKAKGPKGKRGLSHQSSGIMELKGGTSNLNDILENMVMNTSHLLESAMKNHAMQMAVTNLSDTGLIRPAPYKFSKELIPMSQFKKIMEEEGVDVDSMPDELVEGIRDMWALKTPTDKNVIRVMNEGKASFYYVDDPLLLRSLTSVNAAAWGDWMNVFRAPKRWLTNMVTADPAFQAANFVRDTLQAFVISRDNVKPLISGFKGAAKALRKDDQYWEMLAAGGGFHSGFVNAHDPSSSAKIVKAEMRHKDFQKTLIDSPVKLWDRWQEFGSAVENANRIAVYDGALKAGKSKLAAAYEAKDFMDFSMRGDYPIFNFLAQTVPFFNARLQGIYRLGRGIAENPGSFTTRGTLLVMASLALWALNKDDDRYKELQEWDKDTYWHFWVNGEHWRFPKPFEVGFIFGTMPERMFDAMYQDEDPAGQKIMERILWNMHEVFNLGALPQTLGPIAEQIANRDFFRDAPIVGLHMEGLRPEAQYTPWTHETSIKLGEELGVSPARIDHLLRGYFGTIGDYALSATDILVRNVWDFPDEAALRPEDFPVVKRFYRGDDPQSTKYATEYYDMLKELDKTFRTIKDYQKYGQVEKAKSLYEIEKDSLKPLPILQNAKKALGKIRQQTEFIHRTDTMTPDEKRAKLNELADQKNEIYRKVVKQAKKLNQD